MIHENSEPDVGPHDEKRGHVPIPIGPSFARSSSGVSFMFTKEMMMKRSNQTKRFWEPGFSLFTDELTKRRRIPVSPR